MIRLEIELHDGRIEEFTGEHITQISYAGYTTDGNEIRIGSAPAATLDYTLINRDNVLSGKDFTGCVCKYYNDDELFGTFYADKVTKNKKALDFKMSDAMLKFDKLWAGSQFPITAGELLRNICLQCGVSLEPFMDQLVNMNVVVEDEKGLVGETCRTILKYIAQLNCAYATINKNNRLELKFYEFGIPSYDSKKVFYGDCTTFSINEKPCVRNGFMFTRKNADDYYVGDVNNAFVMDMNPFTMNKSDGELQMIGEAIMPKLVFATLYSGEFVFRNLPKSPTGTNQDPEFRVRAGDVFYVVDAELREYPVVAMKVELKNGTNLSVISEGESPDAADSTSTSGGYKKEEDEYSEEIFLGRGQNHQHLDIKGGTFIICDKVVKNVTPFTKVFLNLLANFNYDYTSDKVIYFDIYANDKLAKRLKCDAKVGFNQFNAAFLADLDLDNEENVFTCQVTLEDGETIVVYPFETQMSFIVKSGKIYDAVATNQYFIETLVKPPVSYMDFDNFNIKTIDENMHVAQDMYFQVDLSKNKDGSIIGTYTKSAATGVGTFDIVGSGVLCGTEDADGTLQGRLNKVLDGNEIGEFFDGVNIINISGNITEIGQNFFYTGPNIFEDLDEVNITSPIQTIKTYAFSGLTQYKQFSFNMDFSSVTTIYPNAFSYNLLSDTSAYNLSNLVTAYESAFESSGLNGMYNLSSLQNAGEYAFHYGNCDLGYCRLTPSPAFPAGVELTAFNWNQNFDCVLIVDGATMDRLNPVTGNNRASEFLAGTNVQNIVFINDFIVNNDYGKNTMIQISRNFRGKPTIHYYAGTTDPKYLEAIGIMEDEGCTVSMYQNDQQRIQELLNSYPI